VDNVIISTAYIGPAPCAEGVELAAPCLCGGAPDPEDAGNVFSSGYCCSRGWQESPCGEPPPDDTADVHEPPVEADVEGVEVPVDAPPDSADVSTDGTAQDAGYDPAADVEEEPGESSDGCGCSVAA